ncbi:response regulator [Enterovibrio paralichthyis]|uniref:response regulator n=1 Tax=Enterovibrio paralichthyis TaxID=2853805 RepID=UPI001C459B67|nr:response regulator [Enterovibrio paralichthyis]MBV7296812.1 response regulator [Enterovibrio paralichthyis]
MRETKPLDKVATIAVIDDSVPLCEMLCDLLNEEGYLTQGYFSGQTALEGMADTPPDLILLDIDMPYMDGFEVCERIQSSSLLKQIPVLFISSYSDLDDKLKAFSCGARDYVTKPIQLAEVKARIETHLSLRAYQQALEAKNETLAKTLAELKATQQQLVQTEKLAALGQVVAGVAHEINNPVSFIIGNGHVLKRNAERIESYLTDVHQQSLPSSILARRESLRIDNVVSDISPLVGDVLEAASRVSAIVDDLGLFCSQQHADKSTLKLSELVADAIKWVTANRGFEYAISLELDDSIQVIGNKRQLVQVIINLLNNGLDACKGQQFSPQIVLTSGIGSTQNQAWLSISDNGPGISDGHVQKIFDPFFTTKKVGEGMGLGLAICHRLIAEHGGDLTVQNLPEGGAKFTISLPITD